MQRTYPQPLEGSVDSESIGHCLCPRVKYPVLPQREALQGLVDGQGRAHLLGTDITDRVIAVAVRRSSEDLEQYILHILGTKHWAMPYPPKVKSSQSSVSMKGLCNVHCTLITDPTVGRSEVVQSPAPRQQLQGDHMTHVQVL